MRLEQVVTGFCVCLVVVSMLMGPISTTKENDNDVPTDTLFNEGDLSYEQDMFEGPPVPRTSTLTMDYTFPAPSISLEGEGTKVSMGDLPLTDTTGHPRLPFMTASILVPFGYIVKGVTIETGEEQNYAIDQSIIHAKKPVPLVNDLHEDVIESAKNMPRALSD